MAYTWDYTEKAYEDFVELSENIGKTMFGKYFERIEDDIYTYIPGKNIKFDRYEIEVKKLKHLFDYTKSIKIYYKNKKWLHLTSDGKTFDIKSCHKDLKKIFDDYFESEEFFECLNYHFKINIPENSKITWNASLE